MAEAKKRPSLILITGTFPYNANSGDAPFVRPDFDALRELFDVTVVNFVRGTGSPAALPEGVRHVQLIASTTPWSAFCSLFHPAVWKEYRKARRGASFKTRLLRFKGILSHEDKTVQYMRFLEKEILTPGMEGVFYTLWYRYPTLAFARLPTDYPGMKLVSRLHGYDYQTEQIPYFGFWQPHLMEIDRGMDRLYFVCEAAKEYYLRTYPVERDERKYRVAYLGTGAADTRVEADPDRLVIVSCATAIPLKRVDLIVRAVARLPDDVPVSWRHIGGGPELQTLESLARELLGNKPNVSYTFLGATPNSEIKPYYQRIGASVFLHVSEREGGVPVVLQEAASVGLPMIATAVGGASEIVLDGKTGTLLPTDPAPRQIADALIAFWKLPAERKQAMSDAAYALWAEKYDARRNAAAFAQELLRLSKEI